MAPVASRCSAVVLDIEGTTSAARFVYDTLFPYARTRMRGWLHEHGDDPATATAIAAVAAESGVDPDDRDAVADILESWIDADVKAAPLKALQGLIWAQGYDSGDLRSHFFDDVPPALRAWRQAGLRVVAYSSGSIAAQQSLFAHSTDGDLGALVDANYDLETAGPKRDGASYRRIADDLGIDPARLLFLSDIEDELTAARAAGWQAVGVVRAGEEQATAQEPSIASFGELALTPF